MSEQTPKHKCHDNRFVNSQLNLTEQTEETWKEDFFILFYFFGLSLMLLI